MVEMSKVKILREKMRTLRRTLWRTLWRTEDVMEDGGRRTEDVGLIPKFMYTS